MQENTVAGGADAGTFPLKDANSVADVLNTSEQSLITSVDHASECPPKMVPMMLDFVKRLKLHLKRHCIAKTPGNSFSERRNQLKILSLTGRKVVSREELRGV